LNRSRKVNPIIVIMALAIIMVLATVLILYIAGGRYTTLENGDKFLGEADENGDPLSGIIKKQDGTEATIDVANNTITFSNGDKYVGGIKSGLRHGTGIMTYAATGDVYEGEFDMDAISGKGVFKYSNGDIYEGEVLNGKKHGQGIFTYANGNIYEGGFENDVRSGEGTFTWGESGAKYNGFFKNDLKNGEGVMTYENGDRYEGAFKDDMRHGYGNYFWSNGEQYNGTFINNLMDTRTLDENGKFVTGANGDYVYGEHGVYTFTTGRKFTGAFKEGRSVIVENMQLNTPEQ